MREQSSPLLGAIVKMGVGIFALCVALCSVTLEYWPTSAKAALAIGLVLVAVAAAIQSVRGPHLADLLDTKAPQASELLYSPSVAPLLVVPPPPPPQLSTITPPVVVLTPPPPVIVPISAPELFRGYFIDPYRCEIRSIEIANDWGLLQQLLQAKFPAGKYWDRGQGYRWELLHDPDIGKNLDSYGIVYAPRFWLSWVDCGWRLVNGRHKQYPIEVNYQMAGYALVMLSKVSYIPYWRYNKESFPSALSPSDFAEVVRLRFEHKWRNRLPENDFLNALLRLPELECGAKAKFGPRPGFEQRKDASRVELL
jgi:hypothetical protein